MLGRIVLGKSYQPAFASGSRQQSTWCTEQPLRALASDQVCFGLRTKQKAVDVVRVVVRRGTKPNAAEQLLLQAFEQWPAGTKTKFLVTPGGFSEAEWPAEWNGKKGWDSRPEDIAALIPAAQETLDSIVTERVLAQAKGKVKVMTIGIDVVSDQGLKGPHAELVAVYDVGKRKVLSWTGKSYPTSGQESQLVQVTDMDSHFVEAAGERVMVLGCHDLNMISPRALANQRPGTNRAKRCDELLSRARAFKPTMILQHPHATDTANIWSTPWAGRKQFSTVTTWASAIRYFNPRGKLRSTGGLTEVLDRTRSDNGQVVDIVVTPDGIPSRPSRYMAGLKQF